MEVDQQGVTIVNDNSQYLNPSVIAMRLDTTPILENIRKYLSGKYVVGWKEEADGKVRPVYETTTPKMNEQGVQSIMAWLSQLLNPSTVQGNFINIDEYKDYIYHLRTSLTDHIFMNKVNWGIKTEDISGIIDMIILTLVPFFSRLIGNKERDSYTHTMNTVESTKVAEKRGLFFKS